MKLKFSMSLKVTLILIIVSSSILISLSYINYDNQAKILDASTRIQTEFFVKALDASVLNSIDFNYSSNSTSMVEFDNNANTTESITSIVNSIYQIQSLKIVLLDNSTKDLRVFASYDLTGESKNKPNISYEHRFVFWYGVEENETTGEYEINRSNNKDTDAIIIKEIGTGVYLIYAPIEYKIDDNNISRIGTYEMRFSWAETYNELQGEIKTMLYVSFISTTALISILIYLFNVIFVKPLKLFGNAAKKIGKGNLDVNIEFESNDELNDLANTLNQMARDLKESRLKIEEYNKILENLLNRKDEFIGQLGHDLKNPLQPLVGLLPMLIREEKDPKIKETLQVMYDNVEYMHNLIHNTLQLAKLRSADIEFDMEDINLKEEVDSLISSQSFTLKDNNMEIENNIDNNIFVKADRLRLVEVFKNLISNSIKYKSEKNGKITIEAIKSKNSVTIVFKDNGIGMSVEQVDKVFDEFYKANRFSSEESTGLGLAICKRIIEKHGGHIWVKSPGPGKGSTFYFTLKIGKGGINEEQG